MPVTNIFIARHGETEYNRLNRMQGRGVDVSLNETGQLQAQAIAACLKGDSIDCIISSSLKRSVETAEIIASAFSLKVYSYAELDEMNFGTLEGCPVTEIDNELDELHTNWKSGNIDFTLQNGESPAEVLHRVSGRMEQLLDEHCDSSILFILHGRLIRILLSEWLGYGLAEMHRIEHCNGALYHFKLLNGTYNPVYLNRTEHLPKLI